MRASTAETLVYLCSAADCVRVLAPTQCSTRSPHTCRCDQATKDARLWNERLRNRPIGEEQVVACSVVLRQRQQIVEAGPVIVVKVTLGPADIGNASVYGTLRQLFSEGLLSS